jgi:hypothetical protein
MNRRQRKLRGLASRREAAKRGKAKIVKAGDGIPCPTCNVITERREHVAAPSRKRQRSFYRQWFVCRNPNCKTTTVFRDEDRVLIDSDDPDTQARMESIRQQLRTRR